MSSFTERIKTAWSDQPLRRKGLAVVLLPSSIFLCAMAVAIFVQWRASQAAAWAAHSLEVRLQANRVFAASMAREMGMRGFLASGDRTRLEPWSASVWGGPARSAADESRELEAMVADNDSQTALARALGTAVAAHEEAVASAVSDAGRSAAAEPVAGTQARLDDLREAAIRFRNAEMMLYNHRVAESDAWNRFFLVFFGAAGITGLLAAWAVSALFAEGIAHRLDAVRRNGEALAAGRPGAASLDGADEIGQLARALESAGRLMEEKARALMEGEQRLRAILDHCPSVIYVKDLEGRMVFANKAWKAMQGRTDDSFVGMGERDLWPEAVAEAFARNDRKVLESGGALLVEEKAPSGGELRDFVSQKFALRDAEGSPYAVCGVSTDITHMRTLEAEIAERGERLRAVLSAAEMGTFRWDAAKGSRVEWSPEALRLLGLQPNAELEFEAFLRLVDDRDRGMVTASSRAVMEHSTEFLDEYRIRRADTGEERWLQSRGRAMRGPDNSLDVVEGLLIDITKRKRAEEAAESARRDADSANTAKSEFLSRMSHELRTPLNSIIGFCQLLALDKLEPRQRENVDIVLKAGNHLLGLINEVLDISRIEAGRLTLSPEPVPLEPVLGEVLQYASGLAAQHGVSVSVPDTSDVCVMADRQRLRQVLLNLVTNAIKYNRHGGTASVTFDRTNGHVRIAVRDTGIGIAREKLDRLFLPFDRLGAEQSDVEGTGLGLALTKRLVEAMGSRILVESEPGVGSVFSFVLPAAAPAADIGRREATTPSPTPTRRHRMLYIEDNQMNMTLVEQVAKHHLHVELVPALQGSAGLDLAKSMRPSLILLDLHLPDMHGAEVLRRLKNDAETQDIPVIVLSADATPGQIDRLLQGGARHYLTKPIDVAQLVKLASKIIAYREER